MRPYEPTLNELRKSRNDLIELILNDDLVTVGLIEDLERTEKLIQTITNTQERVRAKNKCTCHDRDSSFTCPACHSDGVFGHMEKELANEWQKEHPDQDVCIC
jgi:hypothetical protein